MAVGGLSTGGGAGTGAGAGVGVLAPVVPSVVPEEGVPEPPEFAGGVLFVTGESNDAAFGPVAPQPQATATTTRARNRKIA